jgi:tetratricopeptide (TPR) repeat protein
VRRPAAAFALCLLALPLPCAGQSYPSVHPLPQTTDAAKLLDQATRREIVERIGFGFAAETRGEWSRAAAEFERVLKLDPREPQHSTALYDLGLAQANLGKSEAARTSFRDAIARDPGFIAARVNAVALDLQLNDLGAARRDADELLARVPDSARALYARGLTALRSGDAALALRDFGALLARDPSYATGRYDLGLAEMKLGRLDDAERELRAALALAPDFARARFALGAVLLRTGRRDEARTTFERAAQSAQDPSLRELALSLRDSIAR